MHLFLFLKKPFKLFIMKKYVLLITGIIFFGYSLKAQFNSGSLFVSGTTSLLFDYAGQKWKSGETESDHAHKLTDISCTASAGYFMKNRMAVGGFIDYGLSKQKADASTYKDCGFLVGPMVRYYLNYNVSGIMPFAEADAGIGSRKSFYDYGEGTSEEKYSIMRASGGVGINYFLNDNIAFETLLKYYYKIENLKDDDYKYMYSGILFRFGITVFFSSI